MSKGMLTAAELRTMKPNGKRGPRRLAGRCLFLEPCPRKLAWLFRYDSPDTGKRSWLSIGSYPAMSLSEARARAEALYAQVQRGIDPKRERAAEVPPTLDAIAAEWDAGRTGRVSDRTRENAMQRLRLHVSPALGDRIITTIQSSEVRAVLDRIVAQGITETAHRTYMAIKQVFDYAEARDMLPGKNPVTPLRRAYPPAPPTHHPSVAGEVEIGKLVAAVDGYQGTYVTRAALRLGLLLFVRPGEELRCARWDEIDLDAAEWRVRGDRMKVKQRTPHMVPLSTQAIAILREHRAAAPPRSPFVFPGRDGKRPMSPNTLNVALNALGYGRDAAQCQRAHAFRALASTHLHNIAVTEQGCGFTGEHVEMQLAHKAIGRVAAAYNRNEFLPQRRILMQRWADEIDRMRALAMGAMGGASCAA